MAPASLRLQCEELESRIVLDNYRWDPAGSTLTWSQVYPLINVSNWERETEDGFWVLYFPRFRQWRFE